MAKMVRLMMTSRQGGISLSGNFQLKVMMAVLTRFSTTPKTVAKAPRRTMFTLRVCTP